MVNVTDGSWDTEESASAFLKEEGYTFPALFDTDSSATGAYGVYALPATYFIDGEGYAVAWAGGMIGSDTLQQGIDMSRPAGGPGQIWLPFRTCAHRSSHLFYLHNHKKR